FNQSYPRFMQNTAWQDEKLNTALSSWTQLRHDYILYAKQTYIPCPIAEGYGYVEPIPEFYSRLSSLCRKIDTELSNEGVLPEKHRDGFSSLAGKLDTLGTYARKITRNETLTTGDDEYGYGGEQDDIHGFGLWLLGFFSGWDGGIMEEEPMLVADVCTNSNTAKVLHEGVGRFNPVIIVYEQPDGVVLAGVGYVMSYYEFEEENFTRVSDSEWKKRVETGALPPRPLWTGSFLYPPEELITPWKGDLNGDGNVTAADAAIALRMAVCGQYVPEADMNRDDRITSVDGLMILQISAGGVENE
ncbi:MAG: DUF3160 domain-containing protein, partial [Gammaproteobacteria bacterium]|nr:DUF3160 domain-containing protein [Gammaproteobacteria bacterium]